MRIGYVCAAALAVAACVGDKAELGGIDTRMDVPAVTQACNQDHLKIVEKGKFLFPGDALAFYMAGKDMPINTMVVRFDVTEGGIPVNISYVGPAADAEAWHQARSSSARWSMA